MMGCLLVAGAASAAPQKLHVKAKDLPVVTKVGPLPEKTQFSNILIELDQHGILFVRGNAVNLNQAAADTLRYTEERVKVRKRDKQPGMDTLRPGVKGSNVVVLLRVHRAAPWRHVQWLMALMNDQRAYKIEFVVRDRRGKVGTTKAWLPLDTTTSAGMEIAVEDDEEDPPTRGIARLKIVAVGQKKRKYGRLEVSVPESAKYAASAESTSDPKKVVALLRRALRQSRDKRLEIRPGGLVPVGAVVGILHAAHKTAKHVDLLDVSMPDKKTRGARPLPWPKK